MHHEACECSKQDIPEIELVIAILTPILEQWWLDAIEDALRQGELLIQPRGDARPALAALDFTRDARVEDEIIAAFEKVLRDRIWAMPREVLQAVEQGRDQLLWDALLAAGLSMTQAEAVVHAGTLEANLGPLRAAAVQDIATLMAGRVLTRLPEVRNATRAWVRATRSPISGPNTPPSSDGVAAARKSLETILGSRDVRRWLAFAVDQWGYRWFTIWNVLDDLETGAMWFQAVAVRDGRTTPFCRWVHGRLISAEKIRDQISNHVRASMRGDIDASMANWPLLSSETARTEGAAADATFGAAFRGVALPPYHGRCRTTVRPVQL